MRLIDIVDTYPGRRGVGEPRETEHVTTYQAVFHGEVIAESDATIVVEGERYFPPDSLAPDIFVRSRKKTLCPWKGIASYLDVDTGSADERRVAWTYRHPSPLARSIKNHVAFRPGSVVVQPADEPAPGSPDDT